MKKAFLKGVVLGLLTFLGLIVVTNIIFSDRYYNLDVMVDSVNGDLVTVIDNNDQVWCMYAKGIYKGEKLTLKMDNNNTVKINDDKIVDIK